MIRLLSVLVVLLAATPLLYAQGVFHWNQNYGTESNLLGGIVIGSVRDVTAAYYNPGYLGLVREPTLIVGAKIVDYSNHSLDFETLADEDLTSARVATSPGFFAGSFAIDTVRTHKFYYSYLARHRADIDFNVKHVEDAPLDPSLDAAVLQFAARRKLSEVWLGFSWGFAPGEHMGLGLTPYVAIRSENFRGSHSESSLDNTSLVGITETNNEYTYWNVRLLAKFGMYWRFTRFTVGFTITTPSINLFGRGSTFAHLATGAHVSGDSTLDAGVLVSDYQEKLHSTYRSSVSLGFGCSYKFHKSRIHFSAEWFNEVPSYNILSPDPFVGQTTGDTLTNNVTMALRSVFNYGIGYDLFFSESVSGYGSIYLDHNARVGQGGFELFDPDMIIYHLTVGANFTIGSVDLTAGLEFSYGSENFSLAIGPHDQDGNAGIEPVRVGAGSMRYFRIRGIISAAFQL
jgi:hypothetical protein